jgi:hypothetical protein
MGNADRTWLDVAWDHPAGRLPVILVPMLATMTLLDLFGRHPDYVGTAASGIAVWAILLWRRPPSGHGS